MNRWTWTEVSFQLLRPIDLSSLRLHLTMTHSSTFSGLRFALFGVTVFPAAENTRSDFELAAGKWGDRYIWFFAFKIFSLPALTRPSTQVPDPSRSKKPYPSDPAGKKRRQDGILLGIEEGRLQEELYNHYVTKIEKIKKLVSGFVQSVLVFPVNFQLEVNT